MFTGLIESLGEVAAVSAIDAGFTLRISSSLASVLRTGESIAVNGVCLTVVEAGKESGVLTAEVGPQTAAVTSLGGLKTGALINLERAMPADGRFGGHMVLGHVDATGVVQSIRPEAEFSWVTVSYPARLAPYLIDRGSVAVDGISLTIAKLDAGSFDVQIVPFTMAHTNLKGMRAGDTVNLECDMVGKYVVKAIEHLAAQKL
jgi:riboflavin synthase